MAKEIELKNGMKALVDDEDFEAVSKHSWNVNIYGPGIVKISFYQSTSKRIITLSSFLMGSLQDKGQMYIFKNGNPYDFRKGNLIIGDRYRRGRYIKGKSGSSSKYKGVSWDKERNKWKAFIDLNGKTKTLGRYANEVEAAKAYNKALLEYFNGDGLMNIIGRDNNAIKNDTRIKRSNKLGYRGIGKSGSKYTSKVCFQGNMFYLGTYNSPEQAARAYDKKAKELFGDKATINFPNL